MNNNKPVVSEQESQADSGECLALSAIIVGFILVFSILLVNSYHDNVSDVGATVQTQNIDNKNFIQKVDERVS